MVAAIDIKINTLQLLGWVQQGEKRAYKSSAAKMLLRICVYRNRSRRVGWERRAWQWRSRNCFFLDYKYTCIMWMRCRSKVLSVCHSTQNYNKYQPSSKSCAAVIVLWYGHARALRHRRSSPSGCWHWLLPSLLHKQGRAVFIFSFYIYFQTSRPAAEGGRKQKCLWLFSSFFVPFYFVIQQSYTSYFYFKKRKQNLSAAIFLPK